MASITIGELLRMKEVNEVWSVPSNATVKDTLEVMANKDVGAILVVDAGKLVGIFSERDYARKILIEGECLLDATVDHVMTTEVVSITSANTVEDCMNLMTQHHFRHLPVVDGGKLAGVISIGDLVKATISGQAQVIDKLEGYITGTDYGKA